jgi:hypothetical protein
MPAVLATPSAVAPGKSLRASLTASSTKGLAGAFLGRQVYAGYPTARVEPSAGRPRLPLRATSTSTS